MNSAIRANNAITRMPIIDILRLNTLNELKHLLRLLELESVDYRNAGWLVQLNNLTNFNHLFEHKPLFNDSCYQLLPKHVIKKYRREARFEDERTEGEQRESVNLRTKRDLSIKERFVESHSLHEFNCNESTAEFVICSYNRFDLDQQTEWTGKLRKQDRTDHHRSLGKPSITMKDSDTLDQLVEKHKSTYSNHLGNHGDNAEGRLEAGKDDIKTTDQQMVVDQSRMEDIKIEETKDDLTKDDLIKQSYLITFHQLTKLLLIFILINLLCAFFISILFCMNRRPSTLKASVSSTHVHFDHYDNSLKFGQFDT